ncbi:MAG: recombinase family protein [Acidimicrobiaceae bacterium]|nr:recombinase family protein [Acidimicrobiaceae bacterium]
MYCRVSTGEQELGIEAQTACVTAYCAAHRWELTGSGRDCGTSGMVTPGDRAGLSALLDALDRGDYDVLVAARLDRLTRDPRGLLELLDRSEAHGWHLAIVDYGLDTSTPAGRLAATSIAAASRFVRDSIAADTTRALAVTRSRGTKLGRPARPETIIAGRVAIKHRRAGMTLGGLAAQLDDTHPRHDGAAWTPSTARRAGLAAIQADDPTLTQHAAKHIWGELHSAAIRERRGETANIRAAS